MYDMAEIIVFEEVDGLIQQVIRARPAIAEIAHKRTSNIRGGNIVTRPKFLTYVTILELMYMFLTNYTMSISRSAISQRLIHLFLSFAAGWVNFLS